MKVLPETYHQINLMSYWAIFVNDLKKTLKKTLRNDRDEKQNHRDNNYVIHHYVSKILWNYRHLSCNVIMQQLTRVIYN